MSNTSFTYASSAAETTPLILSDRFSEAFVYAERVHRLQMRKKTATPYISHLMGVAAIVLEYGGDEDEAIAALLHDAAEDQGGDPRLRDIRNKFGDRVAGIVTACSDSLVEDAAAKRAWRERKAAYHAHLRAQRDPSAHLVSAADKLHNARSIVADIHRHGPDVWKRFNAGREDSICNLRQLVDCYVQDNGRISAIVAELRRVIALL